MQKLSVALGVLAFLTMVMGGIGYNLELWGKDTAFVFFSYGPYIALLALPLALLTVFIRKPRGGALAAVVSAMIFAGLALYFPLKMKMTTESLPFIHDISTDLTQPPKFVELVAIREADTRTKNPTPYPGEETAELQRQGYPDINTLLVAQPLAQVFKAAEIASQNMGWDIVAVVPEEGRIEAVAKTLWFGFKDDIVVRIQPAAEKVAVDIRSKSRVGGSDVGANAKRIRKWQAQFEQAL